MAGPILHMASRDDGSHHIVMGTADFRQAQIIATPDALDSPAFTQMLEHVYLQRDRKDDPRRTKRKPRKR